LERIINYAPSLIIGINLQGNIMIFNKEAERITGYSKEEAIGKSFLPMLIAEAHRDDIAKIFYKVNQDKPTYNLETRIITKNGDERLITWCTGSVKNNEDIIIGGIYIGSDITDKEDLQEGEESTALTQEGTEGAPAPSDQNAVTADGTISSEESTPADGTMSSEESKTSVMEWENVFNSIAEPITIISKDNKILMVNPTFARMLNAEPEELIGKKCCEIFHNMESPIHSCVHKKVFETNEAFSEEVRDQTTGQTTLISCSPFYDPNGELIGSILIARKITKKEEPEESLDPEKLTNIKSFVSAIEHEMNNPLGGVLDFAEAIMEEEDPLKIRLYSKEIIDSATRVIHILSSLTREAQSPKGYLMEPIDLNEIIKSSLNTMSQNEKFENVEIVIDLKPIPKIEGNLDEIQQVIVYLIINSLEAMKGSGKIHISTRTFNGNVQAIIKDEGLEIPNKQLSWMFEPSSLPKPEGNEKGDEKTEIGLRMFAISTILKKHNAPISMESEEGKGRTFIINFPHMKNGKDNA
jgi:PAS domain S-box-containing protein